MQADCERSRRSKCPFRTANMPLASELPPALAKWLESGSLTLTRRLAGRRLTVDRSSDMLLLEDSGRGSA